MGGCPEPPHIATVAKDGDAPAGVREGEAEAQSSPGMTSSPPLPGQSGENQIRIKSSEWET